MFGIAATARAIPAQRVHRLRGQPDMTDNGDTAGRKESDGRRHRLTALKLDCGGAGFGHYARSRGKGLFGACFIAAKGHVDHDDRMIAATHHGGAVRAHHVERDRQRRRQAVNHLRQTVPHQQHVAVGIEQLRHARRIGGEHDDGLLALARLDLRHRQPLHRSGCGMGAAGGCVERIGRRHKGFLARLPGTGQSQGISAARQPPPPDCR